MEVGRSIKLQEYVNDLYMSLLNIHFAKKVSRSRCTIGSCSHMFTSPVHDIMYSYVC